MLKDLVDAVMDEMDDVIVGYLNEYAEWGTTKSAKLEVRHDLELRIKEVLDRNGIPSGT